MKINNLYAKIPKILPAELIEDIFNTKKIKLERIVSKAHATKTGEWLLQSQNEWVILLRGRAELLFEKNEERIILNPGDYITISANTKHRIEWTDKNMETIWLALHYSND